MTVSDVAIREEADLGQISPLGWIPRDDLSYEDWEYAMEGFFLAHRSLNWIIGDGLNFGEKKYGETYAQAIDCTGWSYQRLADAKWVSKAIPIENRREELTWTHHRYVASLPEPAQTEWLVRAEEEGWTTSDLHRSLNGKKAGKIPELIVKPKKRDAKRLFMEFASSVMASRVNPQTPYAVNEFVDTISRDEWEESRWDIYTWAADMREVSSFILRDLYVESTSN